MNPYLKKHRNIIDRTFDHNLKNIRQAYTVNIDHTPIKVGVKFVVAAERCHGAQADGVREKDLRSSV